MLQGGLSKNHDAEISYGIYTIERLPKGSRRTPKWDLHSVAKDLTTAETHAKTLSAQPYYDYIEVQEFRVCAETQKRTVVKVRTYSRHSSGLFFTVTTLAIFAVGVFILFRPYWF